MNQLKPKVLFILHFPPPVHGAAVVGQFIKESKLINASMDTDYINLSTSLTVDDIGKGGLGKFLRYLGVFFKSVIYALRFRPKVVYVTMTTQGVGFYKDAVIVLFLKLLGKKMLFHFHNKGVSKRQHKTFDNWLYKQVFRNSNVILLSENLFSDIAKYLKPSQVYFCPNGIVISDERLILRSTKNSVVNILFIGNLAESKGIYDLLDAIQLLVKQHINFHCNIIGGEGTISKTQLMNKIIEYRLEDKVTYLGRKLGEEKEHYLKSADILVHPSHEECFPLVLLEAMNYGIPVVSTIEGGIPDIVDHGETGFLVEKKDIKNLSDCLKTLITDEQLRDRFGSNGRQKVISKFSIEVFESRMTEIIQKISNVNRSS